MRIGTGILAALVIVGACAPKDKSTRAGTDSAASAGSVAVAAAPSATAPAASPNVVTVHATDFAFKSAPDSIPAGMTTFDLVNDGHAPHHLIVVRLDSGKTMKDLQTELAKPVAPAAWASFQGGPNASDPGTSSNATLDLQPGSYVMMCLVDVPGGIPHFVKGMIRPFTVTASAGASAPAPVSDVAIKLYDYNFDVSKPLTAGKHTFMVTNSAAQMHEVQLVHLAPGKTVDDLLKWLGKPAGPPPGSLVGGAAPFTKTTNYFSADLSPGNYAMICFVPDARDGKPHFMHGMTKTITVS